MLQTEAKVERKDWCHREAFLEKRESKNVRNDEILCFHKVTQSVPASPASLSTSRSSLLPRQDGKTSLSSSPTACSSWGRRGRRPYWWCTSTYWIVNNHPAVQLVNSWVVYVWFSCENLAIVQPGLRETFCIIVIIAHIVIVCKMHMEAKSLSLDRWKVSDINVKLMTRFSSYCFI